MLSVVAPSFWSKYNVCGFVGRVEHNKATLALVGNIRLPSINMPVTNPLAYFVTMSVTDKKKVYNIDMVLRHSA
jgi:hypothetical protein